MRVGRHIVLTRLAGWLGVALAGRCFAQISVEEARERLEAKRALQPATQAATRPATRPISQPNVEPTLSDEDWALARVYYEGHAKYQADIAAIKKKIADGKAAVDADCTNIDNHTTASTYTVRGRMGSGQTYTNYTLNDPGHKLQNKLAEDQKTLAELQGQLSKVVEERVKLDKTIDASPFKIAVDWLMIHPDAHLPKPVVVAATPASQPTFLFPFETKPKAPSTQPAVAPEPDDGKPHKSIFHDPSLGD